jgi:hypothetical protein
MNANFIFWPMIIQAAVTLWLYVPMSRARVAAVKAGTAKASDFRLPNRDETGETRHIVNALSNQFELPVLFFAVCLAAHGAGVVDVTMLALAWGFVIAKTAHVTVHATTNRLRFRRPVFMVAYAIAIAMWLWFAIRLAMA